MYWAIYFILFCGKLFSLSCIWKSDYSTIERQNRLVPLKVKKERKVLKRQNGNSFNKTCEMVQKAIIERVDGISVE